MKFKKIDILFAVIIIILLLFLSWAVKNAVAQVKHSIARLYSKEAITIYCIDGYKWVDSHGVSIKQAYRLNGKGESVPARCDE